MYDDDGEDEDEEGEEVANEEFLEEGPVNTIKPINTIKMDFPKRSCTPKDKVHGWKHH